MAYTKIRPRRGTASEWIKANPVLLEGEIGIEVPSTGIGTGLVRMKFGDGVTPWNSLPYGATESDLVTTYGNSIHVDKAKNAPAFLDIYGVSTQDGTPTPDSPVDFESTVVSEIRICRKQLLNTEDYSQGNYNAQGLPIEDTTVYRFNQAISVKEGETLYFLKKLVIYNYSGVNDNLTFVSQDAQGLLKYTVPSGVTFIKCRIFASDASTFNNNDYMISRSIIDTYEPYTETVYTLPSPITLNGVNDVRDYIDCKRGKLVQNCIKRVLTVDNSNWKTSTVNGHVWFYTDSYTDMKNTSSNPIGELSDKFISANINDVANGNAGNGTFCIMRASYGGRIAFANNACTTLEEFTTWLASNPITVLYPLAEPIETPLSEEVVQVLSDLILYEGVNNITTDSTGEIKLLYATNENSVITLENYKNILKILEMLGGLSFVTISESEYEALSDPDDHTVFIAYEDETE